LLATGSWSGGAQIVGIPGLTPGAQYLIQIWVVDTRSCCKGRLWSFSSDPLGTDPAQTAELNSGVNGDEANFPGQYVVGTFTANSGSLHFRAAGAEGSQINALMVRQIGSGPAQGPKIVRVGFNGAAFEIEASGYDITKQYQLKRSLDLENFADLGGPFVPAGETDTVKDTTPPAGRAFYRIEEAP
jgi:hypothetical protein